MNFNLKKLVAGVTTKNILGGMYAYNRSMPKNNEETHKNIYNFIMNNSKKGNFQNRTSAYKYDIFCVSSLRSIHVNRLGSIRLSNIF